MERQMKKVKLEFCENPNSCKEAYVGTSNDDGKVLSEYIVQWWKKCKQGETFSKYHPKGHLFNRGRIDENYPCCTLISTNLVSGMTAHFSEPRGLSTSECIRIQTFPDNYDFCGMDGKYIIGMSVPPFMMQRIARQIAIQIFDIGSDQE